jgi:hypothetical protein
LPAAARRQRPRPHRRRGGAGPPRPDARPVRRPFSRSRARGWPGSGLPCRPTASAPARAGVAARAFAARAQAASPCGWSRAPTGTARSSGRRSAGCPTIPCSRARRTRTCPISPACASCWPIRRRSFRSSRPTTPSRSPPCIVAAAGAVRVPAPARHGRGALRGGGRRGQARRALPHLRPVGPHEDLVAYLVRRLLENGANTSFVNRLADEAAPLEDIIRDPVESVLSRGRGYRSGAMARAARALCARARSTVPVWR